MTRAAGDRLFPGDVLRRAPFGRQPAGGDPWPVGPRNCGQSSARTVDVRVRMTKKAGRGPYQGWVLQACALVGTSERYYRTRRAGGVSPLFTDSTNGFFKQGAYAPAPGSSFRAADQDAGDEHEQAADDHLQQRRASGVSMKRWRIQEITASSTSTTAMAIAVAV